MRNVFALAGGLAVMAAIVLGDGGNPYQYETSVATGWGDHNSHHHNALVSSRQSPNPLRSRQALVALFTPGVIAAIFSGAVSALVSTLQTTAVNNRVDESNRRVGTNENDIRSSKSKIKTLEDAVGTSTTRGLAKQVADLETRFGPAVPGPSPTVEDLKTALGLPFPYPGAGPKVYNALKDTCDKVNEILNVADLPTTTVDAVGNFQLTKALATAAATTAPTFAAVNGKTFAQGDVIALAAGAATAVSASNTVAVNIADFESFRAATATAFSAMQTKLNEVLQKTTISCNL